MDEAASIERYKGVIVKVGRATVYSAGFPDWSLDYVGFPSGQMPAYRKALMQARVTIEKVTDQRIYFSQ